MKLKDILKGRDKLRKYDELKEWREYFSLNRIIINTEGRSFYSPHIRKTICGHSFLIDELPANIRKIILDALDAEIKKMEED